jgi:hypothetical protein
VREINVSRAGDPVHAGDKALMQETPTQRGRVNRYVLVTKVAKINLDLHFAINISGNSTFVPALTKNTERYEW